MTGKNWNGCLAIFLDPKFAPNTPHVDVAAETEAGSTDVQWINKNKVVVASDSGAVDVWTLIEDGRMLEHSMSLLEHDDLCSSVSIDAGCQQIVSGSWDARYNKFIIVFSQVPPLYNVGSMYRNGQLVSEVTLEK